MSPAPRRDTVAGRAYNDLRNLARSQGRDPAEYLALYALEGFLDRLARSVAADDFVLKGGVLLAAFSARRPTRDIDLAAPGAPNDVDDVRSRIAEIAALDVDDGLTFDTEGLRAERIRDDADDAGVRVHLRATLATARVPLHVDVSFGDPIWPAPQQTELPRLLGGHLSLLGFPVHLVLAEKIVTAVDRGAANTRWRDFVDIEAISRTERVAERDLRTAMTTVANHRHVVMGELTPALAGMAEAAQRRWMVWRRKQRLERTTPETFEELLADVLAFADPLLRGEAVDAWWSPEDRRWV